MRPSPTSGCSATQCAETPAQFAREDGVEETWRIVQPLLDAPPAVRAVAPGSWGPRRGEQARGRGTGWREPWLRC